MLGKFLRGIDIREHGARYAGTINVRKVLGVGPAVVTALYDTLKGVLAVLISLKLGVHPAFAYASGFAAVVGHVFPFYLGFRGGQGVATATGLMLMNLLWLLRRGFFPWFDVFVLAVLSLSLLLITGQGEIIGLFVLPPFIYFIFRNYSFNLLTGFTAGIISYILFIGIRNIRRNSLMELAPEAKSRIKFWRSALRPGATLFAVFYLEFGKELALVVVGTVTIFFLAVDLVRLAHAGINVFVFKNLAVFFKEKEQKSFSSMTLFLIASTLSILLFEASVAVAAIVFLTFGDLFAKFFGLQYGRRRIFGKTLEGTLAYFSFCLVAGSILSDYVVLSPGIILVGAASAAMTELAPTGMDDNLSVALISGAVMSAWRAFGP